MKEMLDYRDIAIVPEQHSDVLTRTMCDVYLKEERITADKTILPIFTSPMPDVVDEYTYDKYLEHDVTPIIPKDVDLGSREGMCFEEGVFSAFSLKETITEFMEGDFDYHFSDEIEENRNFRICIDTANGHITSLCGIVKKLRKKYGDKIVIMAGNVCNSNTYADLAEAGCDFVRVSICAGSCVDRSKLGVYYPQFSLLKACYDAKKANGYSCCIVADGGINTPADFNKALIYADYVMVGRLFASTHESPAEAKFEFNSDVLRSMWRRPSLWKYVRPENLTNLSYHEMCELVEKGYGVTKKLYRAFGNIDNYEGEFSDGVDEWIDDECSLEDRLRELAGSLETAMSYTNSFNLGGYKESRWTICRR